MELPASVLIHYQGESFSLKGNAGTLVQVSADGYYEVNLGFGGNVHRVLLPIHGTVLIQKEPEPPTPEGLEIER
jgi:hypothetical protein